MTSREALCALFFAILVATAGFTWLFGPFGRTSSPTIQSPGVSGAAALGFDAERFSDAASLQALLRQRGLPG